MGRVVFAALALGCVSVAGVAQPVPPVTKPADQSPAVLKVVKLAHDAGMKTMVYFERDDHRSGAPDEVMLKIVAQQPGAGNIFHLDSGPEWKAIWDALAVEAARGGWGRIVVIVDGMTVDVRREPWQGPMTGVSQRAKAEIDRVFPGHIEP